MPYEDGWCPPRIYEHDPRCFSTVALPYDYDPAATCPLWEQTLAEIFPLECDDDNRIAVLQEFMGLTLFPNQMRHEKFLITVGHGANGKSTISAHLGADARAAERDTCAAGRAGR